MDRERYPDEPYRGNVVYVTSDGKLAMKINFPFGLMPPPTLTLHRPTAGPVEFLWAEIYGLRVTADALRCDHDGDVPSVQHPTEEKRQ